VLELEDVLAEEVIVVLIVDELGDVEDIVEEVETLGVWDGDDDEDDEKVVEGEVVGLEVLVLLEVFERSRAYPPTEAIITTITTITATIVREIALLGDL
jgi:hypothetical protein